MDKINGRLEDRIARIEAMIGGVFQEICSFKMAISQSHQPQSALPENTDTLNTDTEVGSSSRALALPKARRVLQAGDDLICERRLLEVLIRLHKARAKHFDPDLMADPAWAILLDLMWASLNNRRISVSSACLASGVPQTTALRYLNEMETLGWIGRCPDPDDGRRTYVSLTPSARSGIREYLRWFGGLLSAAT